MLHRDITPNNGKSNGKEHGKSIGYSGFGFTGFTLG